MDDAKSNEINRFKKNDDISAHGVFIVEILLKIYALACACAHASFAKLSDRIF